jgi:hypothetical protein
MVDLVAVQDARLRNMSDDKVEFLRTLTTFGVASVKEEHSMKDILFSWGAMGPYD